MRRLDVIIQGRLGSERLPGKSLMMLCNRPLIAHVVDRVRRSHVGKVYMVIPLEDTALIDWAWANGVGVSVDRRRRDVLDSYYHCAQSYGIDDIVRVCGDNPLADPEVINLVVKEYQASGYDYVSNTVKRSWPVGLDVEVFSFEALSRAWREATDNYDREHVTPYIYHHLEQFLVKNVLRPEGDISHLRWCVDTAEDFARVNEILKERECV